MKSKRWIAAGLLFFTASGLWACYLVSSRAFLRDFNQGVHAYLAADYLKAEDHLSRAFHRRPQHERVKQLLVKTLIEHSFSQYHRGDFSGALETVQRASPLKITDPGTQQALTKLRDQLSVSPENRPRRIEQVLADLYRKLPEADQPNRLQVVMEQFVKQSEKRQDELLKRFSDNHERWLAQLQQEKDDFRNILYFGLLFFGIVGFILLALFLGALHTYFGQRGIFSRLLEDHYQRILLALPAGAQVLLGPPVSLQHIPEAQKMDIIEAQIMAGDEIGDSHQRLQSFLEGENPWVRARAAKILHRLNPTLALAELKQLVNDASSEAQVPGMWALTELATAESLDLLAPLVDSSTHAIQQGAIRSLIQLQSKPNLPEDVRLKLSSLLAHIRSKTGWIF